MMNALDLIKPYFIENRSKIMIGLLSLIIHLVKHAVYLPTVYQHQEVQRIILAETGHEANLGCWKRLESCGIEIVWWKMDPDSYICPLDDLKNLREINSAEHPLNFRLCKGIYVEPPEIAYKNHDEVNSHFLKNLTFIFQNGMVPGIATHDRYLIDNSYQLIEKFKVSTDRYEFQMLYGVTPELRKSIVEKGHNMRVYVPFGKDWFGYSTRRLKENLSCTRCSGACTAPSEATLRAVAQAAVWTSSIV